MASYQSLYRRYRPQRFDEVLGQAHVTKALRNAVRDDRVGHAYLFSGPRGTGKTSTARILAKVLNCDAPADGEPCGKCDNCVSVAEGRVTDWLLEQDAASKSKVDDMRDLLERVPLGTSGNRKVIILDEVHMLSQGAENALLKTLEEPPSHVVFVLATTDPQKVRPTIRSRTQHFEFRLLPPEVLADHVRHVIDDAGLDAGDVDLAVDHVLRSGGGSARDTLSALDQVAALGEVVDESHPVDAILEALCARDAGQVLVAVADALASGRDPRALGEAVIAGLRDAFLSVMGVAETHLAPADRARAAAVGERLGPAGLTRALDVLGEALVELARKPDPRIVVEVALVRLTEPSSDRTVDALVERVDRLERMIASGGGGPVPGGGGQPGPEPTAPGSSPSARPTPGGGAAPTASSRPGSGAASGGPAAGSGSPSPGGGVGGGIGAAAARDALSTARGTRSDGSAAAAAEAAAAAPARGSSQPTLGAVARGRRAKGDRATADAAAASGTGPPTGAADADTAGTAAAPSGPAGGAAGTGPVGGTDPVASTTAGAPMAPAGITATTPPGTGAAATPAPASAATAAAAPAGAEAAATTATGAPAAGAAATTIATGAPAVGAAAPAASSTPDGASAVPTAGSAPAATTGVGLPTVSEIEAAWTGGVLTSLPVKIRSKWRGGRWLEPSDGSLRFAVPNAWHQNACDEFRRDVEQALGERFERTLTVTFVVEGEQPRSDPSLPGGPPVAPPSDGRGATSVADGADEHEHIDPNDLRDADDVATSGVDLLLREFGGGEVIQEDP